MKKKSFVWAMFGMALILGIALIACDDEIAAEDEAPQPATPAAVTKLPRFEGSFISDEVQAMQFSSQAQTAITTAMLEVLSGSPVANRVLLQSNLLRNLTPLYTENDSDESGSEENESDDDSGDNSEASPGTVRYEENGISLVQTTTITGSAGSFPFTTNVNRVLTIDGTYNGFRIIGSYRIRAATTQTSSTANTTTSNSDVTITASKGGKGMKNRTTSTITMTTSTSSQIPAMTTTMHYAIYDNDNVCRYSFDI
jgi:hypothetical protein